MILKIYKNKSGFINNNHIGNHYFLKNNDYDNKGIFDVSLKSVVSKYKDTKNYMTLEDIAELYLEENTVQLYLELINCKEYNTLDELEFDYLEELI